MILFSQVLRKKHRSFELFPVLLAMGIAWLVAAVLTAAGVYETKADIGFVDLTAMNASPVFRVPTPFQWGMPTFGAAAIVAMFAGVIAGIVESIGDYYACARMSGAPIPDQKTINKGIGMEGIGCVLAGAFGTGNGTTSYSENIGAIGLTRVGSRRVVQIGAAIMIFLGFFPMFSALFGAIPSPIIGGMYCTLFGMIAAVGLSNLQFVDLNSSRNLFVIGMALYLGLSAPVYFGNPELPLLFGEDLTWLNDIVVAIGKTGMAVGAFVAVILDNVIPGSDEERGLNAWKARPEAATPDQPSA
jgi:nucleobase transporter 1/2